MPPWAGRLATCIYILAAWYEENRLPAPEDVSQDAAPSRRRLLGHLAGDAAQGAFAIPVQIAVPFVLHVDNPGEFARLM